ncbi:ATP-binding protein [Bacillus sp. FJAT-29790]|uniref:ATP-binding protein n=1 Tax=Bacillus sp. FJAT-29790 TaxID=1895002 RepID=UPI00349F5410
MIIPFNHEKSIVVASDNSGGIGLKEMDAVQVPYETVAYYSFRVAAMECMSAGARPFSVILQNFCGDGAWPALIAGINKGLEELSLNDAQVNGSTESNFPLLQSAVGMTVLGKKENDSLINPLHFSKQMKIAVIGAPLVGHEVVEREVEVAPLALFQRICSLKDVITLPVGSKGILYELNQLFSNRKFCAAEIQTSLDIHKSSGPSTCLVAVYPPEMQIEIKSMTGRYLHEIHLV